VPILLATSLLQTAFSLSIFTLFLQNKPLLHAFGFPTAAASIYTSTGPKIISLLLAANLFSPLSAVLNFATNAITRTLEYDADRFAAKLGEKYVKGLKSGLVRIHEDNLVSPLRALDDGYETD
jgi:STE24 endopeptidase